MIGALLLAGSAAPAYPIEMTPLSLLCAESDVIAFVVPGPSRPVEPDPSLYEGEEVIVDVRDCLKGRAPHPFRVRWEDLGENICPDYTEGELVLAFLFEGEDYDGTPAWWTVGSTYGTRRLAEPDRAIWGERVLEVVRIQRHRPKDWRDSPEFLDWVVRCMEHRSTRYDGAWELKGGPWRSPLRSTDDDPRPLQEDLREAHRLRLLRALELAPELGAGEIALVEALEDWDDWRLDAALLTHLADDRPDPSWMVLQTIEQLAERWNDPGWTGLQRRYRELRQRVGVEESDAQVQTLLDAFLLHARRR